MSEKESSHELLDVARYRFFEDINGSDGTICPCCDRFGKVYVRKFNAGMARTLIWLYRHRGYTHLPTTAPRSVLSDNQVGKLQFWGMAEAKPNDDDPAKRASGWWRISSVGVAFIEGGITANSHVIEYNQNVMGWRDDQVTMSDVLGRPFHYQELMQETPA